MWHEAIEKAVDYSLFTKLPQGVRVSRPEL
jgi:hypothetical protein